MGPQHLDQSEVLRQLAVAYQAFGTLASMIVVAVVEEPGVVVDIHHRNRHVHLDPWRDHVVAMQY